MISPVFGTRLSQLIPYVTSFGFEGLYPKIATNGCRLQSLIRPDGKHIEVNFFDVSPIGSKTDNAIKQQRADATFVDLMKRH